MQKKTKVEMEISVNKNVVLSDTGFVFNPQTGDSFNTNESGIYILKSLIAGGDIGAIIATLTTEYTVDSSTLERDVEDFITMLKIYKIAE